MEATPAALEALYRERYPRFVATAASIVGTTDGGHDVVQEAFAKALRALRRFDGPALEPWVWRIVVNTARDARRRTGRAPAAAAEEPAFLDARSDDALAAAIRALPPRRRTVVFLRYFADLPLDEIAAVCEISPGTVAATLAQARQALRASLEAGGARA